jgi:hypothetical protein
MDANNTPPWGQRIDEPNREFNFFYKYYLPLGYTRSLRKAYLLYLHEVEPIRIAEGSWINLSQEWQDISNEFDWKGRANEFDKNAMVEAIQAVEEAARKIREAAPKAVDALIESLMNPRLKVAAAKELLDRAGVKTASIVITKELRAEDLAAAEKELEAWTANNESTSSG